ncbi:MAG: hypothetical protein PHN76_08815 [Advenella sp.]|uniref:hypothetical protein n=1 Tax=Advenella sp. TaxID=1872388 RepID=UPI002590CFF6|nr:hypothetical protein [Advenella sp.]MDD3758253.1 hypothetical protein [Advenella sp.]
MEKESKQGFEVVKVLRSKSLVNTGKEYLELGLDGMLESDALKNIPFVSTVVGIFSMIGSVRDHMLANKLLRFFSQLSEISQEERINMVEKLNEDDKFSGRVGATIIEILDRMESQKKPELAAKCFAAFARNEISYEELRRILFALERVPSFDIEKLGGFSEVTIKESLKMDESLLLSFVNAGLGKNNGGYDGGAIVPTNLCRIFVKIGISS